MKKFILPILIFLYFIILTLGVLNISQITTSSTPVHTKIIVSVFNQNTTPIDSATVCVVNDKTYFETGKDGFTKPITIKSNNYDENGYLYLTLLIYKSGFNTHIKHNVCVAKNQTRTGIVIFLYEIYNSTDDTLVVSIDTPPPKVSEQIVKNYKREN